MRKEGMESKRRLSARQIEKALYDEYKERGYKYFSSNTYVTGHECDFIVVTDTNFIIEFEIKRSKYDFLNDFRNKKEKHEKVKTGQLANYFYFVCEEGVIDIKQVPKYCGLIYIEEQKNKKTPFKYSTIRVAPRLHNDKINTDFILKMQTTIINKYYQNIR